MSATGGYSHPMAPFTIRSPPPLQAVLQAQQLFCQAREAYRTASGGTTAAAAAAGVGVRSGYTGNAPCALATPPPAVPPPPLLLPPVLPPPPLLPQPEKDRPPAATGRDGGGGGTSLAAALESLLSSQAKMHREAIALMNRQHDKTLAYMKRLDDKLNAQTKHVDEHETRIGRLERNPLPAARPSAPFVKQRSRSPLASRRARASSRSSSFETRGGRDSHETRVSQRQRSVHYRLLFLSTVLCSAYSTI